MAPRLFQPSHLLAVPLDTPAGDRIQGWRTNRFAVTNYVSHAESWDTADIDGRLEDHDCAITYHRGNQKLTVATVFRDRVSLEAEVEMEQAGAGGAPAAGE